MSWENALLINILQWCGNKIWNWDNQTSQIQACMSIVWTLQPSTCVDNRVLYYLRCMWQWYVFSLSSPDIIGIGFEQEVYFTTEASGSVQVCAGPNVTLNGTRTAAAVMQTVDVTAQGYLWMSLLVVCLISCENVFRMHILVRIFMPWSKNERIWRHWKQQFVR